MDTRSDTVSKVRFEAFTVDLRSGELLKNGNRIRLQDQPFQILSLLLRRPGEVVTREELRRALWPDGIHVDFENGLNIAVKKLRQALDDDADVPKFVETLPRRGYRFVAPVTANASVTASGETESAAALPADRPHKNWRRFGLVAIALVLLAIGGAAVLQTKFLSPGNAGSIRSIAVLPLQNLSGDPAQEYFADGMTEELITDLAQIRALRVISRTSSMAYKKTHKTVPTIGRELNVDAVIEGAVVRAGGRVRITAQLVEAAQDKHLWAASYEQDLRDVLSVQDKVAREIADQVQVQLTPGERHQLARPRPVKPQAYEAYLKGRYYSNELTQDGLTKSGAYFRQAIAIDPNYAPAYIGLAYYYLSEADWRLSPRDSMPKVREAAQRALRLDNSLAEAHADLGTVHFWYDWDWPSAEREFRQALALNPNDARTHSLYASCLAWAGRADDAIAEAKNAIALDPISADTWRILGEAYYFSHRYPEAIAQLRKTVELDRQYWFPHMSLGRAYLQAGKTREAVAELETASRLAPEIPDPLSALGNAYAVAGQRDRANDVLLRLQQLARRVHVSPYYSATVYAGLGDKARALTSLAEAYRERAIFMTWLKTDPALDSLRATPEFQDLYRRIGLSRSHSAL